MKSFYRYPLPFTLLDQRHLLQEEMQKELSLDQVMVMDQAICTSRQLRFQVQRKFNQKVVMNIPVNKIFCVFMYCDIHGTISIKDR